MSLIVLNSSYSGTIKVAPRWPYHEVHVSPQALEQLELAQAQLGSGIRLVLTRGFEPGALATRGMYKLLRKFGGLIFTLIFPSRSSERAEIFSPNGHDIDGTHVDISIEENGQLLKFLSLGVFSTHSSIKRARESHDVILGKVHRALIQYGFEIHYNLTESLQIHCDLNYCNNAAAEQIGVHDSRLVVENM